MIKSEVTASGVGQGVARVKPKSTQTAIRYVLGALSMGALAACGGEGGGGLGVADGGIRGTGSSVGPISGFGSVFVNGVRFDTGDLNGRVQSDDDITTETALDEGMILRIDGQWRENGEGTANRLGYDDTLRGPISVDTAWTDASQTAVISIQGLVVNIDRQTVVKGVTTPANLADGDLVRVSGWRLANGDFRASLVRVHPGTGVAFDMDNEIELEGQVVIFNASPCRFTIGTVLVRCDNPNLQYESLTQADLSSGPFIEVEGNLLGGDLEALEIREDDQRRYRRGSDDDIEFSGPVTEGFSSSTSTFAMNGITVNVTVDTEFDDGLSGQDLLTGLLIQVEGDYQSNGAINALEIELREANAEIEGPIEGGVDRAAGTFSVGGVRIQITPLTLIENDDDGSELTKEQLLDQLGDGVEVEVEGIERETDGIFLEALKIEIDDKQNNGSGFPSFELEGKLREIDNNSLSILGVTMSVSGAAFNNTSQVELDQLIRPFENQYPIVEVEYEALSAVAFQYRATDIQLEDD